MSRLAKASAGLAYVLEQLAGFLLLATVLMVGLQVVLRYLFSASLPWPEELSVLFFGWSAWLGAATALHRKAHLRMDILHDRCSETNRRRLDVLTDVLVLAFLVLLVVKSIPVVRAADITYFAFLPFTVMVLYAALPVGAVLMALLVLIRLFDRSDCVRG